jgi:hypothetical protein
MMLPLLTRELIVVARRPVLTAAAVVYVGLIAGFIFMWGLKLPALTASSFYDALRVFDWGLFAIVMPWVVARCHAPDSGDGLVMLSAASTRRPSSIVLAKIVSLAGVVAVVAIAGVPAAIVAEKMSAVSAAAVLRDLVSSLSLALLVSAVTIAWSVARGNAMTSWVGGSATTAIVLVAASRWTSSRAAQDVSILLVAAAVTAMAATWTDRVFRYCHE